jgi:hypothetical protein
MDVRSTERSVDFHRTKQRYTPENWTLSSHHWENLKPKKVRKSAHSVTILEGPFSFVYLQHRKTCEKKITGHKMSFILLYNFCSKFGLSFSQTIIQRLKVTSCKHPLLLSDFNRNRNVSMKSGRTIRVQYYIFGNSINGSRAVTCEDKHNETNRLFFFKFHCEWAKNAFPYFPCIPCFVNDNT